MCLIDKMIPSNFLLACTILSFWPHATRCEHGRRLGKTTFLGSAEFGFGRARERNVNNSVINRLKPVVTNVDASKKDYQKYANRLYGSIRHTDSLGHNINLNVNHRDDANTQWAKKQLGYPIYQQDWNKVRDSQGDELDRLFKMIQLEPNPHAGYGILDPRGGKHRYEQRNQKRNEDRSRKEKSSEEFVIIEKSDDQCNSMMKEALEYVKHMEMNLLNVESNLRLLLLESERMAAYIDDVDLSLA